jgi:hypothetical protein
LVDTVPSLAVIVMSVVPVRLAAGVIVSVRAARRRGVRVHQECV